jgi:acetyl esterase/lipase
VGLARERTATLAPSVESLLEGRDVELIERSVRGPEGAPDVPVAMFRPTARRGRGQAGILWIHGGGMVCGTRFLGADLPAALAHSSGVVTVSPEYRLAPEHPHPAPVEDCYATLVWFADHAEEFGVDPARMIVAGGSAGGGLAAAVALVARDRGGPPLVGQLLLCPMLDDRNETVSSRQFEGVGVWDRASNLAGWDMLLAGRRGAADISPYAAPARATDLAGLPPAFIDAGSAEVFRDEAVEYASRLWAAGVQAELHVWPGGFHGFGAMVPSSPLSISAGARVMDWLVRTLEL